MIAETGVRLKYYFSVALPLKKPGRFPKLSPWEAVFTLSKMGEFLGSLPHTWFSGANEITNVNGLYSYVNGILQIYLIIVISVHYMFEHSFQYIIFNS